MVKKPDGHDKTRIFEIIGVRLVVVFKLHSKGKLVEGDARIDLDDKKTSRITVEKGSWWIMAKKVSAEV